MKKLRVYVDTSVVGGCCDDEFRAASMAFMEMVGRGDVTMIMSNILVDELLLAPPQVQAVMANLSARNVEAVQDSPEAWRLRDLYIKSKVVTIAHSADALHVAIATVSRADMIVSWNFKHIVHFEKIRGFNAVNLREGYGPLSIYSPLEVV